MESKKEKSKKKKKQHKKDKKWKITLKTVLRNFEETK